EEPESGGSGFRGAGASRSPASRTEAPRDAGRRLVATWETRHPAPSRSTPMPPVDPGSPVWSGPRWPGTPDSAPRLPYKHLLVYLVGYTNPRENASGREILETFEIASGSYPSWQ